MTPKWTMKVPERYKRLKTMPDDPRDSFAYGYRTENAECFMIVHVSATPAF